MDGELVDSFLVRLEAMTDDYEACLKLFRTWKIKYRGDSNSTLKEQVEEEVNKIETDLRTYRKGIVEKKKALQLSNPPTPVVS